MHHGLLLGATLLVLTASATTYAQPAAPAAPITSLGTMLENVRNQASAVSDLLTTDRLTNPIHLHEIATLLDMTALTVHQIATHSEHGQITAEQRAALQAQVDRVQLQLGGLQEILRNEQLR